MTATLADDSALVTHFAANPKELANPIVPVSSQSMGERMILMPQELNAELDGGEIRKLLATIAKKENVVVIVPSKPAAEPWIDNRTAQPLLKIATSVKRRESVFWRFTSKSLVLSYWKIRKVKKVKIPTLSTVYRRCPRAREPLLGVVFYR
jgi:hypothetical protein